MVKHKPKEYICTSCGKEQYTNSFCYGCEGNFFTETQYKKDKRIRQLLHNAIDIMTYEGCLKVAESLNLSNKFDEWLDEAL